MKLKAIRSQFCFVAAVSVFASLSPHVGSAQVLQGFEAPKTVEEITEPQLIQPSNELAPKPQQGSLLFSDLTTPAIDLDRQEIPARATNSTTLTLSARDRSISRAAWSYVENNTNPQTGLVKAIENTNVISLWDFGNAIAAVESARTLNLISKADYDQRIRRIIASLARVELFQGIPNHLIDIQTGRHPQLVNGQDVPKGSQPKDLAYLLTWLEAVKRTTPYLANPIDTLVSGWNFCGQQNKDDQFVNQFSVFGKKVTQPVQGLGFDAFARKGFDLWGFPASATATKSVQKLQVLSIDIPLPVNNLISDDTLYAETFLLDGLLFGWDRTDDVFSEQAEFTDGWRAELAHRIYQLQFERYKKTGVLTARASYQTPDLYVHQPLIDRGVAFKTADANHIPKPELAGISTKAAFWLWALWNTDYSQLLLESVSDTFDRDRGFPEGIFENTNGQIDVYSLDTNAAVLMAMAFKHGGILVPKQNFDVPSLWNKLRQKTNLQNSQCLPKPVFASRAEGKPNYNPYKAIDAANTANTSTGPSMSLIYQHCDSSQEQEIGLDTVANCRFFNQ